MSLSLEKGQNISLSKVDPGLQNVIVGLGWDARSTDGQPFDLDASIFMVNETEKVPSNGYFVFYNQAKSPCGSIIYSGDNLTGDGDGDDETLTVNLSSVDPQVKSLFITVTIHQAEERKQNFGQVRNAFVRLVNQDTGREVVRFDLSEDYSIETAMIFGELYRHNGEWKFRAIGQGLSGGLLGLCQQYGVVLG